MNLTIGQKADAAKSIDPEKLNDLSVYIYESGVMTIITENLTGIAYHKNGKWFDEYDEVIIDDIVAWKPRPEPCRKEDNK